MFEKLRVYSTCRKCGACIQLIHADDQVHPTCAGDIDPPKPGLRHGIISTILAGDDESRRLTCAELAKQKPTPLAKAAVFYAKHYRWPVFPLRAEGCECAGGEKCVPLCQCPKTPATKNGFLDGTSDVARVERYWNRKPNSNIGVATGVAFDVLDVDVPDGIASIHQLINDDMVPPIHGITVTASGGLHFYVEKTGSPNRFRFMPGLDYRGVGGYAVAPPSTLVPTITDDTSELWQWLVPPSPKIKGDGRR